MADLLPRRDGRYTGERDQQLRQLLAEMPSCSKKDFAAAAHEKAYSAACA